MKTRRDLSVFFRTVTGPIATIRECLLCGHVEKVRKGLFGAGRGYGMREGNRARGRMIQHIKAVHGGDLDKAS